MDFAFLVVAFIVILIGAELFTNGIEWFGHKLELAEGAVGSVLAAVGTALPETMIPLIAIVFAGGAEAGEVGVGAILGAPFMLSTLAMFVTGTAVLLMRRRRATAEALVVEPGVLAHDMSYFAVSYALAVIVALAPADLDLLRRAAAIVLLCLYAYYVYAHLKAEATEGGELAPLRFQRLDRRASTDTPVPRLRIVTLQVLFALGCIVLGAWGFVAAIRDLSTSMGVNPTILALIIAPIATELPEKANSVIWVRQGKDTLAMGNITGAMVFQSAIPTSIALVFAPQLWVAEGNGLAFGSAAIAFVSSAAVAIPMVLRQRLTGRFLLVGGILYAAYLVLVLTNLTAPR